MLDALSRRFKKHHVKVASRSPDDNMQCLTSKGDGAAKQQSKYNSRRLRDWHRQEQRVIKLLLLGTGESGKSTLTKQMKIIHINGFSESERLQRVADIKKNLRDGILTIVGALHNLNIPLGDPDNEAAVTYLQSEAYGDDFEYTEVFYDIVAKLWKDKGVQECFKRSNEYQLIDSAKYFLDRVHLIRKKEYIPSDQDLLRCRVMTNSIQRIDFTVADHGADVPFSVFDVGGQQGERRKWIQVFDMTTAILFVVDTSSFDLSLREEKGRNRLLEALEIFEQVWNSRWLRYVPVIVFFNKIDALEEKINHGRSLSMLVDNMDPSNPYHKLLSEFSTFSKIRDSERREFIEAFPRSDPARLSIPGGVLENGHAHSGRQSISRKRSRAASLVREDIGEEVIRTAVFIKRMFMNLVQHPVQSETKSKWHDGHSCEYFYTCAVDTHTIKKVLDGCRSLIIKKHLDTWGM